MKDNGPLWIQIAVACIPLLAAVLAGPFALMNTVSRRIDRLKTLVDIHNSYPDWLNPDFALQRIMIRELKAVERATAPELKPERRLIVTGFALIALTYFVLILFYFGHRYSVPAGIIAVASAILALVVLFSAFAFFSKPAKALRDRYKLLASEIGQRSERMAGASQAGVPPAT